MEHKYNPVTPELVEELKKVVGDRYVKTDEEYLEQYQTDEEGNPHFFKKPEVVVFPGTTEEVAEVVKLANKFLVPITPRSAGTGVACNAHMTPSQIANFCRLDQAGEALMKNAFDRMGLTARSHDRILRVARTIADLDGDAAIGAQHLAEAIQYRNTDILKG